MNIFALSDNVNDAAMWLMDKHVVKMPLESTQMLSTAHRILDGVRTKCKSKTGRNVTRYVLDDERDMHLYTATHVNHPSTVWTTSNRENYIWHYNLLMAMFSEYTYRYGKVHKCENLLPYLKNPPKNIPEGKFFMPTPAMADIYKVSDDSISSYRKYYLEGKMHLAKWTKRNPPSWYVNSGVM